MRGYYAKPEETAKPLTKKAGITRAMSLRRSRTGIFTLPPLKGFVQAVERKYVAPQQVESLLKQSPLVSQAVAVGSGRKQVGALIVPDWDSLKQTLESEGIAAKGTKDELCENPQVIKRVQKDAVEFTREMNEYERGKRVYLLPREFSIDKG